MPVRVSVSSRGEKLKFQKYLFLHPNHSNKTRFILIIIFRMIIYKNFQISNFLTAPRPDFGPRKPEDTQNQEKLIMNFDREGTDQYIFRLNVYKNDQFKEKFGLPQFPLIMEFEQNVNLGVEVLTNMAKGSSFLFKLYFNRGYNRYRRGLETCPQAKPSKSGHAFFFSFFRRVRTTSMTQRRVENTRVHFWTPVSVKCTKIFSRTL